METKWPHHRGMSSANYVSNKYESRAFFGKYRVYWRFFFWWRTFQMKIHNLHVQKKRFLLEREQKKSRPLALQLISVFMNNGMKAFSSADVFGERISMHLRSLYTIRLEVRWTEWLQWWGRWKRYVELWPSRLEIISFLRFSFSLIFRLY